VKPIPDKGLDPNTSFFLLNEGKIVFAGSTEELVHSSDPFVKSFLA
jgi:phospholipid/cholesterol/gamma-HCH transport system ATP-binding protein